MKIAFFIPDLFGGGAQRMIINMALTFADAGHAVDLVLARRDGIYENLIDDSINVVAFGKKRVTGTLFPLIKYLKTTQPDIMLSAMTHTNIFALAAKLLLPMIKTKFVVSERNHFTARTQNSGGKRERIYTFLMPYFYAHADAIVGISNGVADDLIKRTNIPAAKIHAIHNPVVTKDMIAEIDAPHRLSDIEDWIAQNKTPVIVTSGRFVDQKDHKTLLSGFALLQERIPSRLLLLSEGPLKSDIEAQAKELGIHDKLYFSGFIDNPLSAMANADLFVLSSRWEGFGNVLVEALLCGLSVVSTDCPAGPAEILEGGKYGTLVPIQDPQALCDAMATVLKNPADPETQKRRALDFVAEKICRQYESLFQKLQASGQ